MTAPTQQQLNDPAWWDESAPKDAQEYGATNGYFYKEENGVWFYWKSDLNKPWQECSMGQPLAEDRVPRPTRPQAPEWDGNSAPAPGELATTSSGECQVLGWDARREQVAVQWHDGELGVVAIGALKPRAKEDQERFELARDLLDDLSALDINLSGKTATALAISFMNRGWRKRE